MGSSLLWVLAATLALRGGEDEVRKVVPDPVMETVHRGAKDPIRKVLANPGAPPDIPPLYAYSSNLEVTRTLVRGKSMPHLEAKEAWLPSVWLDRIGVPESDKRCGDGYPYTIAFTPAAEDWDRDGRSSKPSLGAFDIGMSNFAGQNFGMNPNQDNVYMVEFIHQDGTTEPGIAKAHLRSLSGKAISWRGCFLNRWRPRPEFLAEQAYYKSIGGSVMEAQLEHMVDPQYLSGAVGFRLRDYRGKVVLECIREPADTTVLEASFTHRVENLPQTVKFKPRGSNKEWLEQPLELDPPSPGPLALVWTVPKEDLEWKNPEMWGANYFVSYDGRGSWIRLDDDRVPREKWPIKKIAPQTYRFELPASYQDFYGKHIKCFFPVFRAVYTRDLEMHVFEVDFKDGKKTVKHYR